MAKEVANEENQRGPDTKKILIIVAGILEALIVIFALVVSIIVFVTILPVGSAQTNVEANGYFIGTLQDNPVIFLVSILVPLIVIFVLDGLFLIYIAVISSKATSTALSQLSEEEKRAILEEAKAEALAEIDAQDKTEEKK